MYYLKKLFDIEMEVWVAIFCSIMGFAFLLILSDLVISDLGILAKIGLSLVLASFCLFLILWGLSAILSIFESKRESVTKELAKDLIAEGMPKKEAEKLSKLMISTLYKVNAICEKKATKNSKYKTGDQADVYRAIYFKECLKWWTNASKRYNRG